LRKRVYYIYIFLIPCFLLAGLTSCKTKKAAVAASAPSKASPPVSKGGLEGKQRIDFERVFFDGNKEKLLGNYDLAETYFSQALLQ
jgi:hypothetical protein